MITRQTETVRLSTDIGIRCSRCNKLLAEKATRPWRIGCVRCGHTNISRPVGQGQVVLAPYQPALPTVEIRPVDGPASGATPRLSEGQALPPTKRVTKKRKARKNQT